MHKYTIIHTRSTYTNVHRYETSGNVYVTGYRITPVMQGQLSPMNDAYITGNALPDILILHTPTRPTYTCICGVDNHLKCIDERSSGLGCTQYEDNC